MRVVDATLRRAIAGAIGIALAASACSASGASPSKATPPNPVPACLRALDLADLLLNENAQTARIDSQIFAGTVTVTDSAARLTALGSSQSKIQPEYERAARDCRAAR